MHARERYWTQNTECVNKLKNQGLKKELGITEYNKQHHLQYYEKNKDKIIARVHKYADEHKVQISKRGKQYRKNNKEQIKARRSKLVTCECGVTYTHDHASRHKRSKHHQSHVKMVEQYEAILDMEKSRKAKYGSIN